MASVRNHKTGSALPVRKRKNGDVEILLMTSRDRMAQLPHEARKGGREGSARGRRQRQDPPRARRRAARTGGRTPSSSGSTFLRSNGRISAGPSATSGGESGYLQKQRQSCFYQSCGLAIISQKMVKIAAKAGNPKANHKRMMIFGRLLLAAASQARSRMRTCIHTTGSLTRR